MTEKDFLSDAAKRQAVSEYADVADGTLAELEQALGRSGAPAAESNTVVVNGDLLKAFQKLKTPSVAIDAPPTDRK